MAILSNTDLVILDLDGTLFDTSMDLARSVNAALAANGLPEHPLDTVVSFIGNGSLNLIRKSVGHTDEALVQEVHRHFLAHYLEHCCEATRPYPGVLEFLQSAPCRKAVLTNKPEAPTRKILQHFGVQHNFAAILGGDTTPERKPGPGGILAILAQTGISAGRSLMVGDDMPDVLAARAAHVRSAVLLSGFGSNDTLAGAQPDAVFADFVAFAQELSQ